MKKWIAFILILSLIVPSAVFAEQAFDAPVPEFTALKTDTTDANTLTGTAKGADIIANAYFRDIKGTYGHESIVRMAAMGVIKQYGDKNYYPATKATGYDVLGMLVRLRGREAQVMQRVYGQAGSSSTTANLKTLMNQEYLTEALALGIITEAELLNLDKAVTKEIVTVWTARAIGKVPVFTQNTVFTYTDWAKVNPVYRALIEDMTTDGIVTLKNDGTFSPKDTLSRGELAVVMAAAFETQYAQRNVVSGFGLIIGVKPETVYEDGNTISRNTITVKNTDGTATKLVSETHTKGKKQQIGRASCRERV